MTTTPSVSARRLLPLIVATTSLGVLTFSLIIPALPELAEELGVSRGAIGLVQGAVAIPGVFLAIFIGYLADLKGRRFVAIVSLLVYGVAGLSGFFVRSFWPLVFVRAIQGLGTSGILSLGVVLIGDLFPPGKRRRKALGFNSAGLTLTGLVSPIIGGWMATGGAFRPFLLFGVALPLAVVARMFPGRPDGPKPAPQLRHLRSMFEGLRADGRLSDFSGLLPFSALLMAVFVGIGFTVTPLFLDKDFALGSTQRGLVIALLSVGSSAGSLTAAAAAARIGARSLLTVAMGLSAAAFAGIAGASSILGVGASLAGLGLGIGLAFPLLQDFVTSSAPPQYRGVVVGTWVSAIRLGQAVGPIAGAALANGIGERATFAIASVVALAMVLAWRPLQRMAATWVRDHLAIPRQPLAR